jgi:hypothetical protein
MRREQLAASRLFLVVKAKKTTDSILLLTLSDMIYKRDKNYNLTLPNEQIDYNN